MKTPATNSGYTPLKRRNRKTLGAIETQGLKDGFNGNPDKFQEICKDNLSKDLRFY